MKIIKELKQGSLLREGAGVKLKRYIGMERHNELDPFLLLDVFNSKEPLDYMAGFPAHPHRGFETVTYLIKGAIAHVDNHGHKGLISDGDVQWMTAGRGIIHSEMPQESEHLWGLQLWLNLPSTEKLCAPKYREYKSSQLPTENNVNGVLVKVVAGITELGTSSPIKDVITEPQFFDITIPRMQSYNLNLAPSHQSILLVLEGSISIVSQNNSQTCSADTLACLEAEGLITLRGDASQNRCLFISAKKIGEPVERMGPFVMNTREEIMQAVNDFQNNRF